MDSLNYVDFLFANKIRFEGALSHPLRWNAYWMLYSTPEAKLEFKTEADYNRWAKWVDFIRSKPE